MTKPTLATPTEAELKLLRILWASGRQSARELHDQLHTETEWSYSTTRKLLERMIAKSLITEKPVHGLKTYKAKVARLNTLATLIRQFSKNFLDTDGPIPVASFVQSRLIDDSDLEELEKLLAVDEAKK